MACLIRLDNGQIFNISNKIDIIGRGSSASVFLDDEGVSRNHAEIFMMSGCVEVIDLNSRNGILVNTKKVRKSFLNDGDKLSVGSVDLVFSSETVESHQTLGMKINDTEDLAAPVAQSSASGKMELIQLQKNDPFLHTNKVTLSPQYLAALFNASLEMNLYKGSRRLSEVALKYIQDMLSPTVTVIKLIDELVIEKPAGSQSRISMQLFESSMDKGMAFLRRKNALTDVSAVICSPILESNKNSTGAIYLEATEKNYEIEDLLFVRALLALAVGVANENSMETMVLDQTPSGKTVMTFSELDLLILGSSAPVTLLKSRVAELTEEKPIMISGPPGTNRNVIANNIHHQSPRAKRPFVYVDCSALNPSKLQEMLFGRKGAKQKGKFKEAEGGSLFLNRLTCLPLDMQEIINLYLKTECIIPIGSNEPEKVSLQLILGVRGRPEGAVKRNTLSGSLVEGCSGKRLHIPPLNERQDDIIEIAQHFFNNFLKKYHKQGMTMAPQTKSKLLNYPWPGNDRELELILERAILCCDHESLTPEYLALPGE